VVLLILSPTKQLLMNRFNPMRSLHIQRQMLMRNTLALLIVKFNWLNYVLKCNWVWFIWVIKILRLSWLLIMLQWHYLMLLSQLVMRSVKEMYYLLLLIRLVIWLFILENYILKVVWNHKQYLYLIRSFH